MSVNSKSRAVRVHLSVRCLDRVCRKELYGVVANWAAYKLKDHVAPRDHRVSRNSLVRLCRFEHVVEEVNSGARSQPKLRATEPGNRVSSMAAARTADHKNGPSDGKRNSKV